MELSPRSLTIFSYTMLIETNGERSQAPTAPFREAAMPGVEVAMRAAYIYLGVCTDAKRQSNLCRGWTDLNAGEFSSPKQGTFYHYNDFWRLDPSTREWTRLEVKGKSPPARSGHRLVYYKVSPSYTDANYHILNPFLELHHLIRRIPGHVPTNKVSARSLDL